MGGCQRAPVLHGPKVWERWELRSEAHLGTPRSKSMVAEKPAAPSRSLKPLKVQA